MKPSIHLENLLKTLPVDDARTKADQLLCFRDLLLEANQSMNLISRGDENRIVERHVLESIGLLSKVQVPINARILDLGSGAGFPGLPLKVVRPDLFMILIESVHKKASFLKATVRSLNLQDVEIVCARMEDVAADIQPVDFVVSRAVASLYKVVKWGGPCVRQGGQFLIIKGTEVEKELQLFEKKADALGAQTWRLEPYSPFYETGVTRNSTLIVIKMSRRP